MPVPMVAPTPNIDSWKSPIERASSLLPVSLPVSSSISTTGLRRNSFWLSEDMAASYRYHLVALTQGSDSPGSAARSRPASRQRYRQSGIHAMSRAVKSAQVSRRTTSRDRPSRGEHDGDPPVAVVVVAHGEAVRPGGRHGQQVADPRIGQRHPVDQHVPALAVPPDHRHHLAVGRIQPVRDAGLESLPEQRDLEVVAHPAVDRDEGDRPALDGGHPVDGGGRRRPPCCGRVR